MVSGFDAANSGNMTTNTHTDGTVRAGSIVVAVDGSVHADQAIARAAEEARLSHRPLALVHVEKQLGAQERGYLAQAGTPLTQRRRGRRSARSRGRCCPAGERGRGDDLGGHWPPRVLLARPAHGVMGASGW
jgi:hypothetical protein